MKIWEKGEGEIDKLFERFTVGKDRELDLYLAPYDVQASIAHAKMLGKIGILTDEESPKLVEGLEAIGEEIAAGNFKISEELEDVHSQLEYQLTEKLGDLGKKIHTGRSRNDQVLVALKLFARAELKQIAEKVIFLFDLLISKSEEFKDYQMPGYTHMQVAMPSSFGLWFGAYAESLIDDLVMVKAAHKIVNKNPMGSAAGYGSSFPVDRDYTTDLLGFESPDHNVVYAQMTRGKMEKAAATAIGAVAGTLSKLSMDICLFSGQNFDFFELPRKFTTGSSIMPHKHNPDGFELLRARSNQLQALPFELTMMVNNLPSGYHRDLQQLKEHFIPAFDSLKDCLDLALLMIGGLSVKADIMQAPKYDLTYTVEVVNQLVQDGVPFRDAYKKVGAMIESGEYVPSKTLSHSHLGSLGNLANDRIKAQFMKEFAYFEEN